MTEQEKLTKAVTPAVLENFYNDKVVPYLNNQIPTFANAFSRGDIIDTTERIVGMFMGKPMYQKVVVTTDSKFDGSVDDAQYIEHEISNIDDIIDYDVMYTTESNSLKLPFVNSIPSGNNDISVWTNATSIYVKVFGGKRAFKSLICTLRYTKTTDTANTIKYGTGNDYSLDEQMVGTWIDGKPLYQKTIDCGALPNGTEKTVAHGINNLNEIISYNGYLYDGTGVTTPFPFANATGPNSTAYLHTNRTNITIGCGTNYEGFKARVTLQYTKTTD